MAKVKQLQISIRTCQQTRPCNKTYKRVLAVQRTTSLMNRSILRYYHLAKLRFHATFCHITNKNCMVFLAYLILQTYNFPVENIRVYGEQNICRHPPFCITMYSGSLLQEKQPEKETLSIIFQHATHCSGLPETHQPLHTKSTFWFSSSVQGPYYIFHIHLWSKQNLNFNIFLESFCIYCLYVLF